MMYVHISILMEAIIIICRLIVDLLEISFDLINLQWRHT